MEDEKNTTSATADVTENTAQSEQNAVSAQSNEPNDTDKEAVAMSEAQAEQKAEPAGNSEAEK